MRIFIPVALLFLHSYTLHAQSPPVSDAGMWTTFSVQKKLGKKFSLAYDQELRLRENYQRLNLLYSNLGLSYKIGSGFRFEVSYRSIQKKQLEGYFSFRHRLQLDMNYKTKVNLVVISARVRYQAEVQNYNTSKKGHIPEKYVRFKVEFKADLNRFYYPYISVETRYQLTSPRGTMPEYNYGFHRVRNIAGVDLKINKRNTIGFYYLVQTEFAVVKPENIYITGVQYSLEL
jgi:hypothetical protein